MLSWAMQTPSLSGLLESLDLFDPSDLLAAFHATKHWPKAAPSDDADAAHMRECLDFWIMMVAGGIETPETADDVLTFLYDAGGHAPGNTPGSIRPLAPRQWLAVFREAFRQGVIGPIALGAALRLLLVQTGGNGAPDHPPHSIEGRRVMLADLRAASPVGIMKPDERDVLAALPDTVTIWRGGRGKFGETPMDRAASLHWALDRDYAMTYLRGRGAERTMTSLRGFGLRFQSSFLAAQLGSPVAAPRTLAENLGQPYLLRAEVPKALVLAYIAAGVARDQVEVLFDFQRVTPEIVADVTPKDWTWAA